MSPASTKQWKDSQMTNALLLAAIVAIESGGNDHARGDHGTAFGAYQASAAAIRDVNRAHGTHYTTRDMTNRAAATFVFNGYVNLYATPERLGRPVTDEDRARIWNGGPDGWRRRATLPYLRKFRRYVK